MKKQRKWLTKQAKLPKKINNIDIDRTKYACGMKQGGMSDV